MQRAKKTLKWLGAILLALSVLLAVALFIVHEPRPEGEPGPEAEALAARMEAAVNVEAFHRTRAIQWTFGGRHSHLWDRDRGLVRVRWGDNEALIREGEARGRAYRDGEEVRGDEAKELLEDAYGHFINDSFWLSPIAKLRDAGVRLETVPVGGGESGLLVSYASGGLTPGDAYLWLVDRDGLPRAWRLWVSIIPVGGVEASWERWVTLDTGARISTLHRGPLGLTVEITDLEGRAMLSDLVADDPFAALWE